MDWDLAGKVTLVGMILVFLALIVLWLIIQLIGFVMKGFNKKNKDKISNQAQKPKEENGKTDVGIDGIDEETVAVISAAIAQYGSESFNIKSIKKKTVVSERFERPRKPWALEGMIEASRRNCER